MRHDLEVQQKRNRLPRESVEVKSKRPPGIKRNAIQILRRNDPLPPLIASHLRQEICPRARVHFKSPLQVVMKALEISEKLRVGNPPDLLGVLRHTLAYGCLEGLEPALRIGDPCQSSFVQAREIRLLY